MGADSERSEEMIRKRKQAESDAHPGKLDVDAPHIDDIENHTEYQLDPRNSQKENRRRHDWLSIVIVIILLIAFPFVLLRFLPRRSKIKGKITTASSVKKIAILDTPIQPDSASTTKKIEQSPLIQEKSLINSSNVQCPTPNLPAKDPHKNIEPLWMPAYPASIIGNNGGAYTKFVEALTGISGSAKLYYRQSKLLRRCHATTVTDDSFVNRGVTCEIHHPIVPCENPHPSDQETNFSKSIVVSIRNPMSAFPAFHQMKAEKYHGAKGQVTKKQWEDFRDEWVGDGGGDKKSHLFEEWKNFVLEWRDMQPYHVALYLPYEHWSDEVKGAGLAKKLSDVFKKEGFPVLYDADETEARDKSEEVECVWRKNILEVVASEENKRAEDGWFVPEYTKNQLSMLANELEKLVTEIKGKGPRPSDDQLIELLEQYKEEAKSLL